MYSTALYSVQDLGLGMDSIMYSIEVYSVQGLGLGMDGIMYSTVMYSMQDLGLDIDGIMMRVEERQMGHQKTRIRPRERKRNQVGSIL